jgi:hypothetical protein
MLFKDSQHRSYTLNTPFKQRLTAKLGRGSHFRHLSPPFRGPRSLGKSLKRTVLGARTAGLGARTVCGIPGLWQREPVRGIPAWAPSRLGCSCPLERDSVKNG